ncbi:MAG TPA: divalent metal cation transporter [Patescibacteria group bacterium]|nr:divalent metal cation transporter [Patescibacteria group bacterium]
MTSTSHKILTKTAEAPSVALGKAVVMTQVVRDASINNAVVRRSKNYWVALGPGLTTGASDDDSSGVATYSQAGAQYGYGLLWMAPWTFPLMAVVQEMCARIGIVTGRGLAGNIRTHFSKKILYVCTIALFAANTFNIGADLGAMAKGVQLLSPQLNFYMLVIGFALFSLLLQIFTSYARYAKYLKYLALILLSYVLSALLAHLNWGDILKHTFVPHISFSKDSILIISAILGTTISPYLFFWQTSQEVEEQIVQGKTTLRMRQPTDPQDIHKMRIDVWSGMFLSNLVMFFIIAACGGILFPHGITTIGTAAQAAEALRPFAGNATYFLFAMGIIGVGLLAIPVLAGSSSYAIAESMGWKQGLYRNLPQARAFYGIIIISMLVGLGINFIGLDPIKALIYAAVGNALVAPLILALIVLLGSNKKIMGHWSNNKLTAIFGWIAFLVMLVSGVATIFSFF